MHGYMASYSACVPDALLSLDQFVASYCLFCYCRAFGFSSAITVVLSCAVSLCLLSQNYDHASNLVQKFGDIEITAGLLKEIDSLVQLIESPIFAFLRLQLLAPQEHASLVRTLYGLLMLLPQSSAFSSLKQRLSCVPVITVIEKEGKSKRQVLSMEALIIRVTSNLIPRPPVNQERGSGNKTKPLYV